MIDESHFHRAQHAEKASLVETNVVAQEEQLDVPYSTNEGSNNIREPVDLPGIVSTEDSSYDQEHDQKEQIADFSIHTPIVDRNSSDVAPNQESGLKVNTSPVDRVFNQEAIELPETTTAADLLSYILQSEKEEEDGCREQAIQEKSDSPLQAPISELTPSKGFPLKKESDLMMTTNLGPGQEQFAVEKVTTTGPVLDKNQADKLEDLSGILNPTKSKPVLATKKESDLIASTIHKSSRENTDTVSGANATLDQVEQGQPREKAKTPPPMPVSKKQDSSLPRLVTTTKSTSRDPIADPDLRGREQVDLPKKQPILKPTKHTAKKQDSDLPRLVTATKSIQKIPGPDHDQVDQGKAVIQPRTPISKPNFSTPTRKKKDSDLHKLVTPTKRVSKNLTPNRVQVDMSAVVKAARSPPVNSVASNHDGASVSMVSTANNTMYSTQHGTHLLRVMNFWVPSKCAVCNTLLFGRKSGSRCEVCQIDCCPDCRLNVDVRVPCGLGSSHSKKKKAPIESLLDFVAPDETFERSRKSLLEKTIDEETIFNEEDLDFSTGIGYLKLSFLQAAIFKQPLPSDEYPEKVFALKQKEKLFQGDYYARISISNSPRTGRTPTVQKSGLPQFRSNQLFFGIEDYGREFRLDIIDSNTDSIVGSASLTTQGILQRQRDAFIQREGASLFQFAKGPIKASEIQEMKVMLRSDTKNGLFASDDRSSDKKPSCK